MKNIQTTQMLLFVSLLVIYAAAQCEQGALKCSSGDCFYPNYIEGCFTYSSLDVCSECQFNYIKEGNLCGYEPRSNKTGCCAGFNSKGVCNLCANGLILEDGMCKDKKIIGCIQKSKTQCINCAKDFYLSQGICIKKIENCQTYNSDGSCSTCEPASDKFGTQCVKKISTNCNFPFTKTTKGDCWVDGCSKIFDQGCQKCSEGYSLLPNYTCKLGSIQGCLKYNAKGECITCYQPLFWLNSGLCIPNGCKNIKSGIVCDQCFTQKGFILNSGVCIIPNCLIADSNGCQVCQSAYTLSSKGCYLMSPKQQCTTCKKGYRQGPNWNCILNEPGCVEYYGDACSKCESQLYLSPNKQCLVKQPGCIYENGICSKCESPYTYRIDKIDCVIEGCKVYDVNGCKSCESGLDLTKIYTCSMPNCIQMLNNRCLKCVENFLLKDDGYCIRSDPYCQTYNLNYACIKCQMGYYMKNGVCTLEKLGCNYVDARCLSCRAPFTYKSLDESCEIDGCLDYFLGGCQKCDKGYDLRYNFCKLPRCLVSHKGFCRECDPDYIMRSDGTCVNKDEFCFKYNSEGYCIECAPKYFLSSTKKCTLREPGCLYNSNDKCYSCEKPFFFDGVRCEIQGCLSLEYYGCSECVYPFVVNGAKLCEIENCDRMELGKCKACKPGFFIEANGSCRYEDGKCQKYGPKGCEICVKGYRVDKNSRCQYSDQHCWEFTKDGNCVNCDRLYFLNSYKKCQLKDSSCKAYSNGFCQECKDLFYSYKGICYSNAKGCLIQKNIKECTKCEPSYTLQSSKCIPSITKLSYNSIDMSDDFFDGETDFGKQQAQNTFTVGKDNKRNLQGAISKGGKVFYSTCDNKYPVFQVDSQGQGWKVSSSTQRSYIGVQMTKMQIFYGIDIKVLSSNTLSKFSIEYSEDGKIYKTVSDFSLTSKVEGSVTTFYFTPVSALTIRLVVLAGAPNIKIQFYYSGQIKQEEISSNTYISQTVQSAIVDSLSEVRIFSATQECVDRELCWMGLELCQAKDIYGFQLVPSPNNQGTILSVYIDYSVDGIKFECYNDCLPINITNNVIKLPKKVTGSKFRVHLVKWQGKPNCGITFNYQNS